jgi:hypothetical protein
MLIKNKKKLNSTIKQKPALCERSVKFRHSSCNLSYKQHIDTRNEEDNLKNFHLFPVSRFHPPLLYGS